jgi:uncharacterized protein (DUF2141 family)
MKSTIHKTQFKENSLLRKNLIAAAVILATSFAIAQKANLTVEMTGFQNNTGLAKVGLYNSKGTFLGATYKSLDAPINNKKATVTFEGLEKGEYAVSIYHDENLNDKMDTNFMGIPKEDYMASNNEKGFMGPPKYDKAKFILKENSKITININ